LKVLTGHLYVAAWYVAMFKALTALPHHRGMAPPPDAARGVWWQHCGSVA
jgi:hypothetical protein